MSSDPIITIDGPSGSGKGTVSRAVARALGWALLDSGALYRLVALAARDAQFELTDAVQLARVAQDLDIRFGAGPAGEGVGGEAGEGERDEGEGRGDEGPRKDEAKDSSESP